MQITVSRVYRRDRGPWGIQDSGGTWYNAWSKIAQTMSEGRTYDIDTHSETYNGKTSIMIDSVHEIGGGSVSAPGGVPVSTPNGSPPPPDQKDKHIFICGVVNAAVATGGPSPQDIYTWARAAADAYDRLWHPERVQSEQDPFNPNDEIPF